MTFSFKTFELKSIDFMRWIWAQKSISHLILILSAWYNYQNDRDRVYKTLLAMTLIFVRRKWIKLWPQIEAKTHNLQSFQPRKKPFLREPKRRTQAQPPSPPSERFVHLHKWALIVSHPLSSHLYWVVLTSLSIDNHNQDNFHHHDWNLERKITFTD